MQWPGCGGNACLHKCLNRKLVQSPVLRECKYTSTIDPQQGGMQVHFSYRLVSPCAIRTSSYMVSHFCIDQSVSHAGLFSLWILQEQLRGCSCRVVAVEPLPPNQQLLQANLRQAQLCNQVCNLIQRFHLCFSGEASPDRCGRPFLINHEIAKFWCSLPQD